MQPSGVNHKYNLKNKINHCRQKSKYFFLGKSDRITAGPFRQQLIG